MNEDQKRNINELLENIDARILEIEAFKEIKISRKNYVLYITILILSIIIAYIFAFAFDTKKMFTLVVEKFLEIEIAFIAIIFGAYALFQAMVSGDFLKIMSGTRNNILKISNKSFLNLILLYLYAIIGNILLWLLLMTLAEDFLLFSNIFLDNILCFFGISIYFVYSIIILCELKNFGINLYKMFNIYNAYKIIISSDEKDE